MKPFRNIFMLFAFVSFFISNAQEYQRTWGTYFGPAGNVGSQISWDNDFKFDASGNYNFVSQVTTNTSFTASYYNQFATSGTGYNTSQYTNYYLAALNPTGNIVSSNYDNVVNFNIPSFAFDPAGNRYSIQYNNSGITNTTGTVGTWNVNGTVNDNKTMLSKFNSSSVLQWKTFVNSNSQITNIAFDSLGNTYIASSTFQQLGFTTSGVFVENFEVLYDNNGNVKPNNYLVKLDANGALVWATYFPTSIYDFKYHNGNLYVLGGVDNNTNASTLATLNSFQSQKANSSITKIDATTGSRIWGTYYGTSISSSYQLSNTIEVNDSGVYVIGDYYDFSGTNNSYFGTLGSHQPIAAGNSDVYLSKFSHSGARLWSTYFGSPGDEYSSFSSSPMAQVGNDIIITLIQYSTNGSANLATPGAYISTMPTNSYFNGAVNLLFAKFNASGVLQWSSYYGGASINNTYNPTMSVIAKNANTFYLYGATLADTGITTPGAAQTAKIPNERTGFIARFDLKTEMATSETDLLKDLVLYDNPNTGNFSISGSILQKNQFQMKIYDMAGRMVYQQKMSREKTQNFDLQNFLSKGNYLVEVRENNAETLKTFKMIVKPFLYK